MTDTAFRFRVSHAGGKPILRFDRVRTPGIPSDDVRVRVNGEWIAANTARREAGGPNVLADLMRGWFGAAAGHPGTHHYVALFRNGGGWLLQAEGKAVAAE